MINKKISRKRFYYFLPLSLLWSCTQDNPTQIDRGVLPEISELIAPSVVYNQSLRKHLISVKVADPQGLTDISEVSYKITPSGASVPVLHGQLVDNGTQGDILPKDGVFVAQIDGQFAGNLTGEFKLEVSARDVAGNVSNVLGAIIQVLAGSENAAPEITGVAVPATVPVDSAFTFLISVAVTDAEGQADIQKVTYQFFPPAHPNPTKEDTLSDRGVAGDLIAGDGVYSATLSSSLFAKIADYFIRFQAEDRAGNQSPARVVTLRGRFQITGAPVISNISVPEIVNAAVNSVALIAAAVSDPQGLADIDTVQVRIFLPEGPEAANSPLILRDDGNPTLSGDQVAGDGVFSGLLSLPGNGTSPIDFKLVFQARDQSGKSSNPVDHILTVAFNDAPYISNLVAPSQVQIDPQRDVKILITIKAKDPQGVADIDTVQFRSFLPSGQEANNSPIQLFDNGDADQGDDRAGDGIFSRFIFLPSQGVTPGDFRFVFQARDKSDLLSNTIEHILRVTQ